jgi:hypothetical protein
VADKKMQIARRKPVVLVLACAISAWAIGPAYQQDTRGKQLREKFEASVASISLVQPRAFTDAPKWVRSELERMGCRIPQAVSEPGPHNLISGAFAAKGQKDWAALCERDGKFRIVVLWGGPKKCGQPFAESKLISGLQLGATGKAEFSRVIQTASPALMERTWKAHEVEKSVLPRHAAIEDIFLEKASTFQYCKNGTWLELPGGD